LKLRIVAYFLIIFLSFARCLHGQSVIKGSVKVYDSETSSYLFNVILTDSSNKILAHTVVDSLRNFYFQSIPNGIIDLRLRFISCYETEIKNIVIKNDTLQLINIPVFEADYILEWDGICTKSLIWGLIKYKRKCCGTEKIENSKFPENNKIFMDCNSSSNDSILFELDPENKKVEIEFEEIKACSNFFNKFNK
jgi:hypothetical protein